MHPPPIALAFYHLRTQNGAATYFLNPGNAFRASVLQSPPTKQIRIGIQTPYVSTCSSISQMTTQPPQHPSLPSVPPHTPARSTPHNLPLIGLAASPPYPIASAPKPSKHSSILNPDHRHHHPLRFHPPARYLLHPCSITYSVLLACGFICRNCV